MAWGKNTNRKHSRIDPATGRNKRDKCTQRDTHGGPRRQIGTGKVVSRAEWRRQQKTAGKRRSRLRSRNYPRDSHDREPG